VSVNDTLFLPVFHELVRHKPQLGAHLASENDDEEEVDSRILAQQVVSSFPWPIGVELRRLLTVGVDAPNRGRLDQILKTIERSCQFLAFVLLAQLLDEALARGEALVPATFRKNFNNYFGRLSLGCLVWLIQSAGEALSAGGIKPFLPEMAALLHKDFYKRLTPWTPIRNEISHYLVNLDDTEIETRCFEYQESLAVLLKDMAFLVKYPLASVTDIRVEKSKRRPASYRHEIKNLNNISANVAGKPRDYDKYLDNRSVLLLKGFKSAPDNYLNLSPLIIDTYPETLDSQEKIKNIKKDIFLYSKFETGRIYYTGAEVSEKCDLRSLSWYDALVEEMTEFFTVLGTGGES